MTGLLVLAAYAAITAAAFWWTGVVHRRDLRRWVASQSRRGAALGSPAASSRTHPPGNFGSRPTVPGPHPGTPPPAPQTPDSGRRRRHHTGGRSVADRGWGADALRELGQAAV